MTDSAERPRNNSAFRLRKNNKLDAMKLAKTTKGIYIESLKSEKVSDLNTLIKLKKLVDKKKKEEDARKLMSKTGNFLGPSKPRIRRRSVKMKSRMASMKELRNIMI